MIASDSRFRKTSATQVNGRLGSHQAQQVRRSVIPGSFRHTSAPSCTAVGRRPLGKKHNSLPLAREFMRHPGIRQNPFSQIPFPSTSQMLGQCSENKRIVKNQKTLPQFLHRYPALLAQPMERRDIRVIVLVHQIPPHHVLRHPFHEIHVEVHLLPQALLLPVSRSPPFPDPRPENIRETSTAIRPAAFPAGTTAIGKPTSPCGRPAPRARSSSRTSSPTSPPPSATSRTAAPVGFTCGPSRRNNEQPRSSSSDFIA